METGRAVVAFGPDRPMEVREYPVLPPERDQLVARITMASICGSDLHMWRGEMPNLGDGAVVPGHEMAGVVHAAGADWATDSLGRPLREGDRVQLTPADGQLYIRPARGGTPVRDFRLWLRSELMGGRWLGCTLLVSRMT